MTRLSVNINKVATLRNARGGENPNVVKVALDCEIFGAQGITVHPRPDERHIRYDDVLALSEVLKTEFNIEGYPDRRLIDLVKKVKPAQVTLVPDPPNAITSNAGWDIGRHKSFLRDVVSELTSAGARVSIFVDPDIRQVERAAAIGAQRIELYTEPYASAYLHDRQKAVTAYVNTAQEALRNGLGVNAGHDLDLNNLAYLVEQIPHIEEVSIGHALICDALYYGLENTIQMYLKQLSR